MSEKTKRKSISLEMKYQIIKMIDNKDSYDKIVKHFGNDLKKNTISMIKTRRERERE